MLPMTSDLFRRLPYRPSVPLFRVQPGTPKNRLQSTRRHVFAELACHRSNTSSRSRTVTAIVTRGTIRFRVSHLLLPPTLASHLRAVLYREAGESGALSSEGRINTAWSPRHLRATLSYFDAVLEEAVLD